MAKKVKVQIWSVHTEMRFSCLLSGGFTTMAVMNPPEKKLANRTSVQCSGGKSE